MNASQAVNSPCNLCEGESFQAISHRDRRGNSLETVVCRDCGLVRHAEIPSDSQLAEFYATRYRQEYHGESQPSDRRVMRAWKNAERIFDQVSAVAPQGGRVVEIGAGIGCTVKRFRMSEFDAWGVEPHIGFCTYGCEQLEANLKNISLEDIEERETHDLVLLVHVIEHFNSPRDSLASIRQLLKPNGLLYVECPNLAAPFAPRANLFHYAHIHNFTPVTLESMANRRGFEVVKLFSSDSNPNLQMLLRRRDGIAFSPNKRGYDGVLNALDRSRFLPYHLRLDYFRRRCVQLAGYAREHVVASRFVEALQQRLAFLESEKHVTECTTRAA